MEPLFVGAKRKEPDVIAPPSKISRSDRSPLTVGKVIDAARELFLEFMHYGMVKEGNQVPYLSPFFPPLHKITWTEREAAEKFGEFFARVAPKHPPFSCYFEQRQKCAQRLIDEGVSQFRLLFENGNFVPLPLTETPLEAWRKLNALIYETPKLADRLAPQIQVFANKLFQRRINKEDWVEAMSIATRLNHLCNLGLNLDLQMRDIYKQILEPFKLDNIQALVGFMYFHSKSTLTPEFRSKIEDILEQLPDTHTREKLLLTKVVLPKLASTIVFFPSGESTTLERYEHEGLCLVSSFYEAQVAFHTAQKKSFHFSIGDMREPHAPSLAEFNLFLYFALGTIFHTQPGPRTLSLEEWQTLIRMASFFQLKQNHKMLFEFLNEDLLPRTLAGLLQLLELQEALQTYLMDPLLQKAWIDFREGFFGDLLAEQKTNEEIDKLFKTLFEFQAEYAKDQSSWLWIREFNLIKLNERIWDQLVKANPEKLLIPESCTTPPYFKLELLSKLKIFGTNERRAKNQKSFFLGKSVASRSVQELQLTLLPYNQEWYQKMLCKKLPSLQIIKFFPVPPRQVSDGEGKLLYWNGKDYSESTPEASFQEWIKTLTATDFPGIKIYFDGRPIER